MTECSLTIIVPTFRRPDDLKIAVRSIFDQTLYKRTDCTLVIVDNDPSGSAAEAIEVLRKECPSTLKFIGAHEPRAGVANARNCAMTFVTSDLIVFLDDDQAVKDQEWLETLYTHYLEFRPSVIFGPIETTLPDSVTEHQTYFKDFFKHDDEMPRGLIEHYYGCGNTLLDVAQLPKDGPVFDAAMNETGGEDDVLFDRIKAIGGTFSWEPDALIYERVPASRAQLSYTLRRALIYGQGPTNMALKYKQYHMIPVWFAIGSLKLAFHGMLAAFGFLFRRPDRAKQFDLALRGLGKIMFWKRYDLYGEAALKRAGVAGQDKASATAAG